jgi:hypothetical protein
VNGRAIREASVARLVIVGEGLTTVAFGSGSLTLAGWHRNEEIWTVFQAKERAPRAVGPIGAWLSSLPEHVRIAAAAASATERVGGMLVALPTSDDESPELVSSTAGPSSSACLKTRSMSLSSTCPSSTTVSERSRRLSSEWSDRATRPRPSHR